MKLLNYRLNICCKKSCFPPIIFIHGLFGSLSNFNTLSREFNKKKINTVQIDLRNHGQSPHEELMNYEIMAQDITNVLDHLCIYHCIVVGHSIGGKVAMILPLFLKQRVVKMIIIDIAPITYTRQKYCNIFAAINHINTIQITTRNDAFCIMNKFIKDTNIILFLLKSFKNGTWDFNIKNIQKNYLILNEWKFYIPWNGDVLFISGGSSSYITKNYYSNIYQQFPKASISVINGAGHWVHSEKRNDVLNIIHQFLLK